MAVHVLLDHGVKQENIIFLSIIAAPEGRLSSHVMM